MKHFLQLIALVFVVIFQVSAQQKVTVYLNLSKDDTLSECYTILQSQYKRAAPVELEKKEEKSFRGSGILLSAEPGNWPQYAKLLRKRGPEGVYIKGDGKSLIIIGNSRLAVQQGLFSYLFKLGFRYFFPHPDWHIIPTLKNLYPVFTYSGQPSYDHRRIWYGYGTGSTKSDKDYAFWFKANRQGGAMNAYFGQAYDDIVYRNQEEFKKHPEWFYPEPVAGTLPSDPKFNISNEQLVQFVINDVIKRIDKSKKDGTPLYKMISMSPSDGPGICNTPECKKFGTVTDRVCYLANRVAKIVRQKYPDSWIGIYAYSEFNEPPTIALEPNIFVGITTTFNYSKYSIPELVKLWSKKATKTGIYDYFSNYVWDRDVVGQSLASRTEEALNNIRKYYKMGAKGYECESTTGWVSKGLGHYLSAQLMWDINANTDQLKEEFFKLSFGKAAVIMKQLWTDWSINRFSTPRQSDLARWMDLLSKAYLLEADINVLARLNQVKSYLCYLSLLRKYSESKTEKDLINLLNFGYRMLDEGSFAGYPALFELASASNLNGFWYNDPNAKYKFNKIPVTVHELDKLFQQERSGLKTIPPLQQFKLSTSFVLAPVADRWKNIGDNYSGVDNALWYPHEFVVKVNKQDTKNYLEISGGYVSGGGSDKPISVYVFKYLDKAPAGETPLLSYNYTARLKKDTISLAKLPPGLYRLRISDPVKIFRFRFSGMLSYSMLITPDMQLNSTFSNHLFLYVPKGVSHFSITKNVEVRFVTPTGRVVDLLNKKAEETDIPVLTGEQGLWRIDYFSGSLFFEGIPQVLGILPSRMLIPASSE